MALLRDKTHAPPTPVGWTDRTTGVMTPWSPTDPWEKFYSNIRAFYEKNGRASEIPSDETVQDRVCQQAGPAWCIGNQDFRAPRPVSRGCSSCGRR